MMVKFGSSGTPKTSSMGTQWLRGSERRGSDERYWEISTSWGLRSLSTSFNTTRELSEMRTASRM